MLNLTPEEKRVLLFLAVIFLVGIVFNFSAKANTKVKAWVNSAQDLGKINLNTADKQLLITLPGIGEKIAGCIIEYRLSQGNFLELKDLKRVKGITSSRYEKLKDYLVVK
jgi:competence protein ComEA